MNMLMLMSSMMFLIGVYIFSSKRKHLLLMLLSLEFIVLSLFLMFMSMMEMIQAEIYYVIMFFVFSVCEGSLGLSVLVSMVRSYGNDYYSSLSLVEC
uniref:NADH-ubiquinone oxidoreductase chain 4L n=1 Tax=Ellipes minuta TaxID=241046 RepID=E0YCH0_9ORTH|nr:NADH dehydrogenase subunit 4L [Ellipes minuta]ADD97005.1 NADH dehydrogenase subunit 4L [Ellipes minuta]